MAITSKFWDGIAYDDDDFTDAFYDVVGEFVIPGKGGQAIGDELRVVPGAVGTVDVLPGDAFVRGAYYSSDASVNVAIDATAGANPAIYAIVLDRDSATNTVDIEVVKGTEAAIPSFPGVGAVNGFVLAYIYVDGAYNPAADTISATVIWDYRPFFDTGYNESQQTRKNYIPNSEFYGYSNGGGSAPDGWVLVSTPTIGPVAVSTFESRGYRVRINSAVAGRGMKISVPLPMDTTGTTERLFTFFCYIYRNTAASGSALQFNFYGIKRTSNVATLLKTIDRYAFTGTGAGNLVLERIPVSGDALNGYDGIVVEIITLTGGITNDFYISLPSLTRGYIAINPINQHELIWFDAGLTDASWNLSAKSTANNTIDLTASFAATFALPPYARGIIAKIRCRDSGSAAAAADNGAAVLVYHINQTPGTDPQLTAVSCSGLPNDSITSKTVYIPLDQGSATPSFILRTVATGAGTLDVEVVILGVIT